VNIAHNDVMLLEGSFCISELPLEIKKPILILPYSRTNCNKFPVYFGLYSTNKFFDTSYLYIF